MPQEYVGGRFTQFGRRDSENKFGASYSRVDGSTELMYVFDFDDMPAASDQNNMVYCIPESSIIEQVAVYAQEAAAGTGPLVVAHVTPEDTDPVVLASVTTAALTEGAHVLGAGAGVGVSVGAASIRQIRVTGDFTAGKFKVVVKYRAPLADAAGIDEDL